MKAFAQIENGRIKQVAIGFSRPPFGEAIEVPADVAQDPESWRYEKGKFVRIPQTSSKAPKQPTLEELVQALAELQAREKIRDPKWRPKVDLTEKLQMLEDRIAP